MVTINLVKQFFVPNDSSIDEVMERINNKIKEYDVAVFERKNCYLSYIEETDNKLEYVVELTYVINPFLLSRNDAAAGRYVHVRMTLLDNFVESLLYDYENRQDPSL